MCRDRAAKRPQQYQLDAHILGALRTPFATQGRSYRGPRKLHEDSDHQTAVHGNIAYACGPHAFVQAAASLFKGKVAQWHEESFSLPELARGTGETIQLTLLKQNRVLEIPNNQPILAALEAAGINRPYGCRMGVCNTCSCRKATGTSQNLLSGDAAYEEEAALKICISSATSNMALDI